MGSFVCNAVDLFTNDTSVSLHTVHMSSDENEFNVRK